MVGAVTHRDADRTEPGFEESVGDDVSVGADGRTGGIVGVGTVGEEHATERGGVGGQTLSDLDRDGQEARLGRVGGGERDDVVGVERAERDVLADLLAQLIEDRLGPGAETAPAEVPGAQSEDPGVTSKRPWMLRT